MWNLGEVRGPFANVGYSTPLLFSRRVPTPRALHGRRGTPSRRASASKASGSTRPRLSRLVGNPLGVASGSAAVRVLDPSPRSCEAIESQPDRATSHAQQTGQFADADLGVDLACGRHPRRHERVIGPRTTRTAPAIRHGHTGPLEWGPTGSSSLLGRRAGPARVPDARTTRRVPARTRARRRGRLEVRQADERFTRPTSA